MRPQGRGSGGEAAGLTREELAELSGVSVRAISDLERGLTRKPHPRSVRALAGALGMPETLSNELIARYRAARDAELGWRRSSSWNRVAAPDALSPGRERIDSGAERIDCAVPAVARQLPPAVPHFAGRADELKILASLAAEAAAADQPAAAGTVVISMVAGTAGVGKTALALHFAHQVADRFPDGQLYINLRGFDPSGTPVSPGRAIRGFLDALALPAERIPGSPDAQAGLYRSVLAGKRMLVVLDNASETAQVEPLLPASPGCLVLITSRNQLTGLAATHQARLLTLDPLPDAEARQVLTARLRTARATAEPGAVTELIALCAGLPLALAVAAARAAAAPRMRLSVLTAELRDTASRLDALDAGEPAVSARTVFSWSYRELTVTAARLFRLLGLHPGPDISIPAAVSLAGTGPHPTSAALRELTRANLIAEHAPGRYNLHDLLRSYATECAHAEDSESERRAAIHRMHDYYLHAAITADRLLYPHRDPIALGPGQAGVVPAQLTSGRQALAWFETERPVLIAVLGQAAERELGTGIWQLAWALETFFYRRGYWHDWAATQRAALAAALRTGDLVGQAHAYRGSGAACTELRAYQEGRAYATLALQLYQRVGDRVGQARVLIDIAASAEKQGHLQEALCRGEQAMELFRAENHRLGLAFAFNHVGWFHARLGNYEQAVDYCERGLNLDQEMGDRHTEAPTWDSLAYAHCQLGHHAVAAACYRRALELYDELGFRVKQAEVLSCLGDTQRATGNAAAARDAWQQALVILDDLHHLDASQIRAKLRDLDPPAQKQPRDRPLADRRGVSR